MANQQSETESKETGKMSSVASEEGGHHYSPQHPLPETIKKMDRDETICRYCGVSYLIHNEIKALERKIKDLEAELVTFRGCQERELQLQRDLTVLQDQRGEFEMNITVKDAAIATLTNNLKNQEEMNEKLRKQKDKMEVRTEEAETSNKSLKERNNTLESHLRTFKFDLHKQKLSLDDIHTFTEMRDRQMKDEIAVLLSHIQATCDHEIKEKDQLHTEISTLKSRWGSATQETEELQTRLSQQEGQIRDLERVFVDNKGLQEKCKVLETTQTNLRKELEESIEESRKLKLETKQFREQLKSKTGEVEEITVNQRRKEQQIEMTTQKLKTDLKRKEADLLGARRELNDLQNKCEQQNQLGEDLSRKASKSQNETKDLKDSFLKAKEEIEHLKDEREVMISSHQNRIEQLRESFKGKLSEADAWPEKLEAAIRAEKERHARELNALEQRLKESFVMELEIEKSKYQELMKKYQAGSHENEEKMRIQLQSIESRYQAEIADLNEMLAENRRKSKEMEDELRREIASLKNIIRDLESRLGRLDMGNDELVSKLKVQLQETHQELEQTREELDNRQKVAQGFQEEIKHLQQTVHNECEERFELTEALSVAKEELLLLKKPIGHMNGHDHTSDFGGYSSMTPRQKTNMSLQALRADDDTSSVTTHLIRSSSEPQPLSRPISSKPPNTRYYSGGGKREYTTLNTSKNMVFTSENEPGVRTVGSKQRTGNSLADNRRRIAAILGRK